MSIENCGFVQFHLTTRTKNSASLDGAQGPLGRYGFVQVVRLAVVQFACLTQHPYRRVGLAQFDLGQHGFTDTYLAGGFGEIEPSGRSHLSPSVIERHWIPPLLG